MARLRQAFFAAFDLPWMQGHWFSEEEAPGHKYVPSLGHAVSLLCLLTVYKLLSTLVRHLCPS